MVLASDRDTGVTTGEFLTGTAIGAVGMVALPLTAYYLLGKRLREHPRAMAGVWAATQPPLLAYLWLVLLWSASLVACGPDAYECPI